MRRRFEVGDVETTCDAMLAHIAGIGLMKLIQRRLAGCLIFTFALTTGGLSFGQTETDPAPTQAPIPQGDPETAPPAVPEPTPEESTAPPRYAIPDLENLDIDEETKKVIKKILPIDKISTDISPSEGPLPPDQSKIIFTETSDSYANRAWPILEFHWEANEIVFQSPYWEQTPLERYGQTISPKLQPVLSGLHFFGTFPIIPYKMGIDRPFDRISVLGYYQPGSPTPCVRQRLPWEWDAALMQAGFWVGGYAIFP